MTVLLLPREGTRMSLSCHKDSRDVNFVISSVTEKPFALRDHRANKIGELNSILNVPTLR